MDNYAAVFVDYQEKQRHSESSSSHSKRLTSHKISFQTVATAVALSDYAILLIIECLLLGTQAPHVRPIAFLLPVWVSALTIYLWSKSGIYSRQSIAKVAHFAARYAILLAGVVLPVLALSCAVQLGAGYVHKVLMDLALFAAPACLALGVSHAAWTLAFKKLVESGSLKSDIVLFGVSEVTVQFLRYIAKHQRGVTVRGVFGDHAGLVGQTIEGVPVLGTMPDLLNYHTQYPNDTVIVTPPADFSTLQSVTRRLKMQPLRVRLLSSTLGRLPDGRQDSHASDIPGVPLIALFDPPIEKTELFLKDVFDRVCAAIAIVLFAPVLAACVAGIKLSSPGPILFRQKRIGYRNTIFYVYKFRSMHARSCDLITLTQRNDPRIFKFGEIMRKLSLDELPQLFNVLQGDMSLVGPRPHMPEARAAGKLYYEIVDDYAARHRVKPGITGWAQVNGWRGPTETEEAIEQRVAHDLYYIENWSLWLDIKILFKTVLGGFFGRNAF